MSLCACQQHAVKPVSTRVRLNASFKRDPSRTNPIKNAFIRDGHRRFNALMREVRTAIVKNDCFDIERMVAILKGLAAPGRKAYQFQSSVQKLDSFMDWLRAEEKTGVLETIIRRGTRSGMEAPWTDVYIQRAYERGVRRGRAELSKAGYGVVPVENVPGGVAAIMAGPVHADRVALLYSRTFENLKSVTDVANGQIRQRIADGLSSGLARGMAEGKNSLVIARELYKDVGNRLDKIGKTRLRMIARTEIIRAHHVATITEYEAADRDMEVSVQAEWLTAGFEVCPLCLDLEAGGPYKLDVIYDMIPAHPGCRCSTIPLVKEGKGKHVRRRTVTAPIVRAPGTPIMPTPITTRPIPVTTKPVMPPPSFMYQPKKTLEECEKWVTDNANVKNVYYKQQAGFRAKGLGSQMSKKTALEHFNATNAGIDDFQRRHNITLPEVDYFYITKTDQGLAGFSRSSGNAISFTHKPWTPLAWDRIEAWEQRTGKKWDFVRQADNRPYNVRHEYAHIMDYSKGITKSERFNRMRKQLREEFNFVSGDISEYAATNAREWFAEAMSQYTSKQYSSVKRFPMPLEEFLENVLDQFRKTSQ